MSEKDVESKIATQLAPDLGGSKPTVKCPGNLKGKVGTTLDCTVTVAGNPKKIPIVVTVDKVSGGTVDFHISSGK